VILTFICSLFRFFNPAIATPEVYELSDPRKKTKNSQRNFILLSKLIQNLANNVKFGNKETYMICMNEFLSSKTFEMRKFLVSIVDMEKAHQGTVVFGCKNCFILFYDY